ncbi:MAG: SRPBCC domain-containing protein [Xanthobacteraceae bacterium]
MPATSEAVSKTGLTVDRDANTIRIVREFGARPPVIFDAWTQPEHVACWWDPAGERLAECAIDLRPGGSFKFVSRAHPEMPFAGVYREIKRPERLEFDALGAKGRVTLQSVGAGTRMVVEIECASAEHLEQFLKMGVDAGTAQTSDNLVAYVRERGPVVASA